MVEAEEESRKNWYNVLSVVDVRQGSMGIDIICEILVSHLVSDKLMGGQFMPMQRGRRKTYSRHAICKGLECCTSREMEWKVDGVKQRNSATCMCELGVVPGIEDELKLT